MVEIEFIFNQKQIVINTEKEEKMKNICYKFAQIVGKDINNLLFTYNGENINGDFTFIQQAYIKDQYKNKITIFVTEKNINNINIEDAPLPVFANNNSTDFFQIKFDEMTQKNELNELRNIIDKFNTDIKYIINIFNNAIENMEIYYKIKCNKINKICYNNNNYFINEDNYRDLIKDINQVINDNSLNNKINNILNIYKKFNINKETNNNIIIEENNEIFIRYKAEQNKDIQIFGHNFVENNKDICKIICEGDEYNLSEFFKVTNENNLLDISLTNINKIQDMSYMFYKCPSLISIATKNSKWDNNNKFILLA